MKNEQKAASFVKKLYSIIRSKQHSKSIMWDSELKGIRIVDQNKLQQLVLPRYYRHNRLPSFVRQLNMYGFSKINLKDNTSVFIHQHFNPHDEQSLFLVKRKVTHNLNCEKKQLKIQEIQKDKENQVIVKSLKKDIKMDSYNTLKQIFKSDRQNIWSARSSFKIFKNSIQFQNDKRSQIFENNDEELKSKEQQILETLVSKILQQNKNSDQKKKLISKFSKQRNFCHYLRKKSFKLKLYQRLGIQFNEQNDKLQELSIQGELLYKTRRSLTNKSLRLFDSGSLYLFNDTIGNLLNL